ncbi:MAG: DUF2188 domain-containing protein [Acidobacteriota bacterium]
MRSNTSKSKIKQYSTKAASKNRKNNVYNLHVVPRIGGWAVRTEGSSRARSIHGSQREAIEAARKLAKEAAMQLVIHGRDGRIRERDSYSQEPLPPKQPRKVLYPSSSPNTSRQAIRRAVSEAVREVSEKQSLVSKAG